MLIPLFFLLFSGPVFAAPALPEAPLPKAEIPTEAEEEPDADAENATVAKVNEAWDAIWSGQREMINEIRDTAQQLGDNFAKQTENLAQHMQPFEEEGRRLLVFANTFKGYPNAMEAVSRRISATVGSLEQVLEPVTMSRAEAQGLLERVNYMAASLPDEGDKSRLSPEMRGYVDDIVKARLRLTAVLAQYDSLLPSLTLLTHLEEARKKIQAAMPEMWKNYYLQKPVAWLNPDVWINVSRDIRYAWQAMMLRLPVELPTTAPQWGTAVLRFCIGLVFVGILSFLLKRRWLKANASKASAHIFTISIPWLALGFALVGGAMSATGDFFRAFLAMGSFCLIVGQIFIAWDVRMLQYPEIEYRKAPFLRFLPLTVWGYALLYLPITEPICLVLWILAVVFCLVEHKNWKRETWGPMQIEAGVMDCYTIILWISLFLALSGLHIFGIALYLSYVALAVALEISFGGIALIGRINEHLPQEGARAVIARLIVALAAPFVLVLAVAGICLWVAILPGGTYLLGEYALKGVTVGATQFNIIQVLMITSVFYLTRTVVAMGTKFLAKLPQQGLNFDATLITPMQTALTYAAWAVFGLFVLKSLGMELSNLAMVAGGLSVGIGFGMQNIVNNFISGLILIFGRTLQVGDVVEVGGTTGRVRKISVRATMVETYDNAIIYVPNSEFMAGRLINWTSFSRSVRREVQVGVAYGSDTEKVIKLLIGIASSTENVLKYPVPSVNFADFGASSLDFRLRFWVRDFDLGASTASRIRLEIDHVFSRENIDISFPQLDVHIKDMPRDVPRFKRGMPRPENPSARRKPRSLPAGNSQAQGGQKGDGEAVSGA